MFSAVIWKLRSQTNSMLAPLLKQENFIKPQFRLIRNLYQEPKFLKILIMAMLDHFLILISTICLIFDSTQISEEQ